MCDISRIWSSRYIGFGFGVAVDSLVFQLLLLPLLFSSVPFAHWRFLWMCMHLGCETTFASSQMAIFVAWMWYASSLARSAATTAAAAVVATWTLGCRDCISRHVFFLAFIENFTYSLVRRRRNEENLSFVIVRYTNSDRRCSVSSWKDDAASNVSTFFNGEDGNSTKVANKNSTPIKYEFSRL